MRALRLCWSAAFSLVCVACAPEPGPVVMPSTCVNGVPPGAPAFGITRFTHRIPPLAGHYPVPPQFHPVIDIAARDRVGFSACGVGSDLGWLLGATLWNLPPERPVVIEPSVGGVPETDPNMVFSLLRCTNRACDAGLGRDTDTSPLYGCEKKRAEIREYSKEQGRLSVLITLEFSGDIRSELDLDLTWDPAQVPPSKYDDPVGGAGGMGGTPGAPSAGAGGR